MSDSRGQMVGPANQSIIEIRAMGRRLKIIFSVGYVAFLLIVGSISGYAYWVVPPEMLPSEMLANRGRVLTILGWSPVVWLALMGIVHLHVLYSVWRAKAALDDAPAATTDIEEKRNFLHVIEGDEKAALAAIRRFNLRFLGILVVSGILLSLALRIVAPSSLLVIPLTIVIILSMGTCIFLFLSVCVPDDLTRYWKSANVWIGSDFLAGGAAGVPGGRVFSRYADIFRVGLYMAKGQITGATIWTKTGVLNARFMEDPAAIVRVICEHTGPEVKWRRSSRPFSRLSREDVKTLIDRGGGLDIDSLLPPGATYLSLDEFRAASTPPDQKGWKTVDFVSTTVPTPARQYVGFMLLGMFQSKTETRSLNRSEALLPLTAGKQTAEPPPLDDVLNRLKVLCNLKPKAYKKPVDGVFDIQIQNVPCKVTCHFDDRADTCCVIRLETE